LAQSLFIYWHVAPAQQARAEAAARRFQGEEQARDPGLAAHLYRRTDTVKGRVTLMETYACEGGLSPALLGRLVAASAEALGALAQGGRHVEVFEAAD
jgi:hypothetical protein